MADVGEVNSGAQGAQGAQGTQGTQGTQGAAVTGDSATKESNIGSRSTAFTMDMTLLKKVVTATYDVSTSLTPNNQNPTTKTVTTKALVMPESIKSGSQTDGFTISEFVNEVNSIAGNLNGVDQNEIQDKISNAGNITDSSILEGISIVLKEIFFYYESTKIYDITPSNNNGTLKAGGTSSFEYAFDIEIKNKDFMKNDIFTINSLSFAIWNTKRTNIIKKMNLFQINDILDNQNTKL